MDFRDKALNYSKREKISIELKAPLETREDFCLAYTPGIAEVSKEILKDKEKIKELTFRRNNLAVISDGSAVLGLGNIGPEAGYPVMEGKAMIFKKFAGINAIPIVLDTQDNEQVIATIKNISKSFSAINLEDFSAPRCFEIEERLVKELEIPLMHDDQHGTAIVVLAALINAKKITGKPDSMKIVISGAGAAGIAISNLLSDYGFKNMIVVDSKGIISRQRSDLNKYKKKLLEFTNSENKEGGLDIAVENADVFIGVSKGDILTEEHIKKMNSPIVFAMANPVPEIMPEKAYNAGAKIVGTGRSDFPNQINNALAFPGVFRGALDANAKKITEKMKIAAVQAIVEYHEKNLSEKNLLPDILDSEAHRFVAKKVMESSLQKE